MTVDQPNTTAPHIGAPTFSFDPGLAAQIDLSVTERFLALFASPGEHVHIQTFADGPDDVFEMVSRKRKDGSSYTVPRYRLTLPDGKVASGDVVSTHNLAIDAINSSNTALARINLCRGGVFWAVNRLKAGQRRGNDNVEAVRAVFLDLDGAPLPPTWPLPPTAIVESSPGKWHVYWHVVDMPLDRFTTAQKYLAATYGGDLAVCDLARVMRLPGYFHSKAEPFLTRIAEENKDAAYTTAELLEAFEGLADAIAQADQIETDRLARVVEQQARSAALRDESATMQATDRTAAQGKYVEAALWGEVANVGGALQGQRNNQLYKSAARLGNIVGTNLLDRALVEYELTAVAISIGLGEHETRTTLASGLDHGIKQPLQLDSDGFLAGVGERAGKKAGKAAKGKQTKGGKQSKGGNQQPSDKQSDAVMEQWDVGNMTFCVENHVIGELCVGKDEGEYTKPLCNFEATIIAQVASDAGDGEVQRQVSLTGTLYNGKPLSECTVPITEFLTMNWPARYWGAQVVVNPGISTKDKLRAAIQSRNLEGMNDHKVYLHTGWRKFEQHGWTYLHGAGGICSTGAIDDVSVSLSGKLKHYVLPAPLTGDELRSAMAASLSILDVGPDTVTVPVWLSVWRAVIMPARFSVFIYGKSGSRKTGLATVALQHLGAGHARDALPGNWESTENALEAVLFETKDALVVIDDFNPRGGQQDVKKWHAKADRVLRSQANGAGRSRQVVRPGSVLEARPDRPPRGLVVVTGEDLPQGQSLEARLLSVSVSPGDVNLERLKAVSRAGNAGVLAGLSAAYLQWLAPRLEQVRQTLTTRALELQGHFPASHDQNTDQGAHLLAGFEVWSQFAVDSGCLSDEQVAALNRRIQKALGVVVASQDDNQVASDPVNRFLELLTSVLSSGAAHVSDTDGEAPVNPTSWGWQLRTFGTGENARTDPVPQGPRIGWLPGNGELWLDPDATWAAVQTLATRQGEGFAKTQRTLWRGLAERGLILLDAKRPVNRRYIQGKQQRVLVFKPGVLLAGDKTEKLVLETEKSDPLGLPLSPSDTHISTLKTNKTSSAQGYTPPATSTFDATSEYGAESAVPDGAADNFAMVQTPENDLFEGEI
jgi:hypothetical protein